MKLIESSAEYIPQDNTYEGIIRHIEKCARVCYKSENNQSNSLEDSENFLRMLVKSGHTSMLEHGTIYFNIPIAPTNLWTNNRFIRNPYSKVKTINEQKYYATTNLRIFFDSMSDLGIYQCEPTEDHEKRYTFKLVTSIGIVRELLRHRKFSFANESTRYCNYSTDKFNNEITYIIPSWYHGNTPENILEKITDSGQMAYYQALEQCERTYYAMLFSGLQPQQAREVLPLCTKSELIMTGFESDWKHFFDLRLFGKTGKPHPDMVILCEKIKNECIKNNIMTNIFKEQ